MENFIKMLKMIELVKCSSVFSETFAVDRINYLPTFVIDKDILIFKKEFMALLQGIAHKKISIGSLDRSISNL